MSDLHSRVLYSVPHHICSLQLGQPCSGVDLLSHSSKLKSPDRFSPTTPPSPGGSHSSHSSALLQAIPNLLIPRHNSYKITKILYNLIKNLEINEQVSHQHLPSTEATPAHLCFQVEQGVLSSPVSSFSAKPARPLWTS